MDELKELRRLMDDLRRAGWRMSIATSQTERDAITKVVRATEGAMESLFKRVSRQS